MENMHILIEQMISDISDQAARLDEIRLGMFLAWIKAHSSRLKIPAAPDLQAAEGVQINAAFQGQGRIEDLRNGLKGWFPDLPLQGLLWEYRLLLEEINWLRTLDPAALTRIFKEDGRA